MTEVKAIEADNLFDLRERIDAAMDEYSPFKGYRLRDIKFAESSVVITDGEGLNDRTVIWHHYSAILIFDDTD